MPVLHLWKLRDHVLLLLQMYSGVVMDNSLTLASVLSEWDY